MNWGVWVVPVIALAVWILLQMRAPDGPAAQQNRPGPPEGDRPRRPKGDVGLFLEEIERLRRQSAPPQPLPPPAPPVRESAPPREQAPAREPAPVPAT
ncbi:MAG: hypothetical protein JNM56_37260, partial [Planctomycetia bacterium]|nr:hypothetical protein [Planctomycetia bacterium]